MRLSTDQLLEIGSDAHFLDGGFDHDDIIQHLVYIAEGVSKEAMVNKTPGVPDVDNLECAVINLESLVKATAYIALMREKMMELRKGGASCS